MPKLTHIDGSGGVRMINVGAKPPTQRIARVQTKVILSPSTFTLLEQRALPKGDVLTAAKIAGIQAAKLTPQLIPMCHPLPLTHIDITFTILPDKSEILIESCCETTSQTGVEMEALVAAQMAALTIYDMCKAVQKDIKITDCQLIYKSGGKSGTFSLKK